MVPLMKRVVNKSFRQSSCKFVMYSDPEGYGSVPEVKLFTLTGVKIVWLRWVSLHTKKNIFINLEFLLLSEVFELVPLEEFPFLDFLWLQVIIVSLLHRFSWIACFPAYANLCRLLHKDFRGRYQRSELLLLFSGRLV